MDIYSSFETIQTGLSTVMQSAEKGKEAFEDLRKFSNETTFGVDELASASTQLMNVGMTFEDAKDKLRQLGDISGGSKEKFADLVSIFAKIESTGKASSMQLNQLALRGVPIIQMLKDMGVEGKASARDIEKAFEEMTKSGGQFHGAMENILQTIEGKKGEIADFWKEFNVSFAEASGLADTYKSALDVVRNTVVKLADAMKVINENPLMKALLQGVLLSGITLIGSALIGTLVPALIKVATQLGIISGLTAVINPVGLAIAGVVGVVGVLATTIHNYNAEMEEANQQALELERKGVMNKYGNLDLENSGGTGYSEEISNTITELAKIQQEYKLIEKSIREAEQIGEDVSYAYKEQLQLLKQQEDTLSGKLTYLRKEEIMQQKLLELDKQRKQLQETQKQKMEDAIADVESQLAKYRTKTIQDQILELQKLKNATYETTTYQTIGGGLREMKSSVGLSNEQKSEIDELIGYLKEELKKGTTTPVHNEETWQDRFKNATGTNVSDLGTEKEALSRYLTNFDDEKNKLKDLNNMLGITSTAESKYKELLDEYNQKLQVLFNLANEGFEKNKDAIAGLGAELLNLSEDVKKAKEEMEKWDIPNMLNDKLTSLGNSLKNGDKSFGTAMEYTGVNMAQSAISASGDAQNFMQGMASGGIFGGIINTVIGAFMNVAGTVEGFDKVMNPVTHAMQMFKPVIEVIISVLSDVVDEMEIPLQAVSSILNAIAPVLKIISVLLKVINLPLNLISALLKSLGKILEPFFKMISDALQWVVDMINGFLSLLGLGNEEMEEADKNLEALNEQYRSLTDNLKSYEEYYLQKRRQLDAQNEINKITGVNDMIISPHGNFSTHPDDYIMAMKNPSSLMGNGGINVVVKNEVGEYATASARVINNNGNAELFVQISKKIASDVASGSNGWDGAMTAREQRLQGRRITL